MAVRPAIVHSGSERRIADLAAAGLTNRQIAQRLFLTMKTVESHLTTVFRKLDVTSRREVAAALGEERHDQLGASTPAAPPD